MLVEEQHLVPSSLITPPTTPLPTCPRYEPLLSNKSKKGVEIALWGRKESEKKDRLEWRQAQAVGAIRATQPCVILAVHCSTYRTK